jgi:hypothetical protein
MLVSCEECSTRSLETKWSLMKHDIFKFCSKYEVVIALNKSGVCNEDVCQKNHGVSMFTWVTPSPLGECISWHIGRIFLFVIRKISLKIFIWPNKILHYTFMWRCVQKISPKICHILRIFPKIKFGTMFLKH